MSTLINKKEYQRKVLKKVVLKTHPDTHILFTPISTDVFLQAMKATQSEDVENSTGIDIFYRIVTEHAVDENGEKIFENRAEVERTLDFIDVRHIGEELVSMSLLEEEKKDSAPTRRPRKSKDSESA